MRSDELPLLQLLWFGNLAILHILALEGHEVNVDCTLNTLCGVPVVNDSFHFSCNFHKSYTNSFDLRTIGLSRPRCS